jgi:hypothetical protein
MEVGVPVDKADDKAGLVAGVLVARVLVSVPVAELATGIGKLTGGLFVVFAIAPAGSREKYVHAVSQGFSLMNRKP